MIPAVIGVVVLIALGLGSVVAVALSDRKRRTRGSLNVDDGWLDKPGNCTTIIRLELASGRTGTELKQIATDAIRSIGGSELIVGDNIVVGWTSVPPMGLGWAPQEIAVRIRQSGPVTALDCASRPRFATALYDARRNRLVAKKLASDILSSYDEGGETRLTPIP